VETARPSPFASSLAFAYVANFLYEGDAPLAERRAQALTLDRDLLAELLGAEELRELIHPEALSNLEADLQALDERRWARHPDAPLGSLLGRWARTHPPFTSVEPAQRFGLPVAMVDDLLARRADAGLLLRGEFRPDGSEREWCDPDVLRSLRQRSLALLRREVEPVEAEALARFLPAWHGVGSKTGGMSRLVEVVSQLQGVPIPASVLERDVLAARVADYSPALLDQLAAAGELVWVSAGPLRRDDGKVMLLLRR